MTLARDRLLKGLNETEYDVIVIGGGIVGVGVARELALRNIKTLLVEQKDFASGSSSRTTKCVSGNLSALSKGRVARAWRSMRERNTLLKNALVTTMPFFIPHYENAKPSVWIREAQLLLYDMLSGLGFAKRHRFYGATRAKEIAPRLFSADLLGASEYYDGVVDDARLTLETLNAAREHGAHAINYLRLIGVETDRGALAREFQLKDAQTGTVYTARCKAAVNATGAWLDGVARLFDSDKRISIFPAKGVHLYARTKEAAASRAYTYLDDKGTRLLHAVPWKERSLVIGASLADYRGDPGCAYAESGEVEYLLDQFETYFPALYRKSDILIAQAGIRPSIMFQGRTAHAAGKGYRIVTHKTANVISVAGGTLTVHRAMAEDACHAVMRALRVKKTPRVSSKPPFLKNVSLEGKRCIVPKETLRALASYAGYTEIALRVEAYAERDPLLMRFVGGDKRVPLALIRYFIEDEMAITLEDVMARRLRFMFTEDDCGVLIAEKIAEAMAPFLGWDAKEIARQIALYRAEVKRNRIALF